MDKPFAITLDVGSSLANKTGAWRTNRPLYVDRLPPCNHACPAGENIQGWLYHAESGDYEAAWRVLTEDNPLPAIMGRVCYHPCEGACNRGQIDEAVGINSVERFLGDEALKQGWKFAPPKAETGKRVLVVGAGPSGLSAAYHLRRRGHGVTIVEAGPLAGGMMRFGIPKYRLPRDVLDARSRAHRRSRRRPAAQHQGHGYPSRRCARAGTTRRSSRSARTSPSARTSRRARPRRCSMRWRYCEAWRATRSRCSAAAWSSTAAATRRSTWRVRRSGWARAKRSSSTVARARRCRRTTSRSRKRCRKAC